MTNRRDVLQALSTAVPLYMAWRTGALASDAPALDRWAQGVVDTNRALAAGELKLTQWQDRIQALHNTVEIAVVLKYLDVKALTAGFAYPDRLAQTVDPKFPKTVDIAGVERPWFIRIFAMRKGGAVIPHAHNNMVSAHL